jgi:hypothetical protein
MGATFQTIPTPNPNESSFQLTIDDRDLKPSDMPVKNTPYSAWTWGQKDRINEGWENYVYSYSTQAAGGKRVFVFVKARTLAEALTPFDTYWTTKQFRWPMVLHALGFLMDWSSPSNPQVQFSDIVTPATEAACDVKVELFLSHIPFTKSVMQHRQLITNDLVVSHYGYSAIYRDCLHPTVKYYQSLSTQGDLQEDYGTEGVATVFESGDRTIAGTSFTDWSPHVISDQQEPSNGLYLREKQTIYPPRTRPPVATR